MVKLLLIPLVLPPRSPPYPVQLLRLCFDRVCPFFVGVSRSRSCCDVVSTSICMSLKPSTMTLGLVSPSLIGLGSRRPRLNLSTIASSSAKSTSWWMLVFSDVMKGENELWIGVGILPDMLVDGSFWNEPGERCTESVISKSSE